MINTTQPTILLNSKDVYQAVWGRDTLLPADAKVVSKAYPALVAVGALLTVGGVFTLLAAYQILPAGPNLMSGLGAKGLVVGYVATSAGPIFLIVYLLKKRLVKESNRSQAVRELKQEMRTKLHAGEYVMMDEQETLHTYIYHSELSDINNTRTIDLTTLKKRFPKQPTIE